MKTLLTFLFILATMQSGQSPEEMYGQYDKNGQYQAMQEQMDEVTQKSEAAEKERSDKTTFVIVISLVLGLIPIAVIVVFVVVMRKN